MIDRRGFLGSLALLGYEVFAMPSISGAQIPVLRLRRRPTVSDMNLALWPSNVLEPRVGGIPAVGDASYVDGSGTNDGPELQARINAALGTPGVSIASLLMPNRVYRINSTLTIDAGLFLEGTGGRGGNLANTGQPPTIVWNGAAGGTMIDVAVAAQNIPMTAFRNLCLTGRTDGNFRPGIGIRFRGTGGNQGSIDTGTILDNVWIQNITTPLSIEGGATNFFINGGRMDAWSGYAIDVAGQAASITIGGNFTAANAFANDGFLRLATTDYSIVKLYGLHLEAATLNQTFATGTNPFDRRGLIRLVVDVSKSATQHKVYCDGLQLACPFGIPSFSTFQVTGTSADSGLDTSKMIHIHGAVLVGVERGVTNANANDEIRVLGGNLHNTVRPPLMTSDHIDMFRYGIGKNVPIVSWSNVTAL